MARVLRAPLLHFLVIGALLLGLRTWREPAAAPRARIVIGAADRARLRETWTEEHGAPPSGAAEEALVRDAIDEEVLYREALARGFDRRDAAVRERLVRLGGFVSEEAGGSRDVLEHEARRLGLERSDLVVRRHLVEMMQLAAGWLGPHDRTRRRVHPRRGGGRHGRGPRAHLRARVRGGGRRGAAPDLGRSRALELRAPSGVGARARARADPGAGRGAGASGPALAAGAERAARAGGDGGDAGAVRGRGRRVTFTNVQVGAVTVLAPGVYCNGMGVLRPCGHPPPEWIWTYPLAPVSAGSSPTALRRSRTSSRRRTVRRCRHLPRYSYSRPSRRRCCWCGRSPSPSCRCRPYRRSRRRN